MNILLKENLDKIRKFCMEYDVERLYAIIFRITAILICL